MTDNSPPGWYVEGDPLATVRAAHFAPGSEDDVIDVLSEFEFNAPREIVADVIEQSPADSTHGKQSDLLDEPQPFPERLVDATDIEYLSAREFATILGATFMRAEGRFVVPDPAEDFVVDLFWSKQHTGAAIRTVPAQQRTSVSTEVVERIAEADIEAPSGVRSPSKTAIVTNTRFGDEAHRVAETYNIQLFERSALNRWLRRARISTEVVGELLDEGPRSDDEIRELLEELPDVPQMTAEWSPLAEPPDETRLSIDIGTAEPRTVTGDDSSDTSIQTLPTPSARGQRGELYANPNDDGDYDAFDEYVDGLTDGEEEE